MPPLQSWSKIAPRLDSDGLDLLSHLLVYDPAHRYSAAEALAHPYFAELTHLPAGASMRLGAAVAAASAAAAAGAGAGGGPTTGVGGSSGGSDHPTPDPTHDADGDDVL